MRGDRAPEILLTLTMLLAAGLKVADLGDVADEAALLKSPAAILGLSMLEIGIAISLFSPLRMFGFGACALLAVGGVWLMLVTRWFSPPVETCGCFGAAGLSDGQHSVLAAAVLTLALVGMRRRDAEKGSAGIEGSVSGGYSPR